MANFTLDDIRTAADKKYGSTNIELGDEGMVELVNPLRLDKDKRKRLMSIQDEMDTEEGEDERDQEDVLRDALRLVARDGSPVEALLGHIGDDLGQLAAIFEMYTKGTDAGEA